MYKLCIALGWSVIRMQLLSLYQVEHYEIWEKIKQHRILTSESLEDYYSQKASDEGLLEQYQQFMATILYSDQFLEIEDRGKDLSKSLSDYLKNRCNVVAVVIDDQDEFKISKSACRYKYTIREAAKDEDGPFGMYSVKANFYAEEGVSANKYLLWLENQLRDEKEVNIIDPYIINDSRNYECLKKYYFPLIKRGSILNIHTIDGAIYSDVVARDAKEYNIKVNIYKYRKMHDRYITTSDRVIIITLGCDFMKEKGNSTPTIRNGTNFALKKKDNEKKHLEVERRLAGEPLW